MKNHSLSALLLASLLVPLGWGEDSLSLERIAHLGKETTDGLHHRLQKEIAKHQANGLVDMTDFCIHNAQAITQAYNRELGGGITVKRISLKNRNDVNKAASDEAPILEALELLSRSSAYLPEHVIQIDEHGSYKYYRPIVLTKRGCVACHGGPENIAREVRAMVAENYPNDKAIYYNRGDLRGAFVVEIRPKVTADTNQTTTKDLP